MAGVEVFMAVGRVLSGRYQIEELLGSGGMATVWRGRDLRLGRPVAVKVLTGAWLRDPIAVQRFEREARTAARLAHPNVVGVHDVGVDSDSHYLVMEYVEGETVAAMLDSRPLSVAQTVAIVMQVCDGLAAAHSAGIVHRDVKPANVILTPTGVAKICDFGIARVLMGSADTSLTGAAFAMGSSKYMAPEQAYGEDLDARTDLYALGCTMYAMLTGAAPFSGDNAVEVLHRHLTEPPAPLRQHRADVPPLLEALIAQLLAKDPADRPVDAAEVKARLMALPQDPTTAAIPLSTEATVPTVRPPRGAAAVDPQPPATAEPHVTRWRVAVAVLVTAVAATGALLLATSGSDPSGTTGSLATSAASSDTAAAPSATATPEPTAAQPSTVTGSSRPTQPAAVLEPSSQAPEVDPIAAMRLSIQEQVDTGNLNPDMASDLFKKVDEIAKELNEGDEEEAAKKINDLRNKLTSLRRDGKLTDTGYDTLIRDVDRVATLLP